MQGPLKNTARNETLFMQKMCITINDQSFTELGDAPGPL